MIADVQTAGALSPATVVTILSALVFLTLAVFAGARDAVTYIIPNWISLTIVAAFAVAALAVGLPAWTVGQHLLGAVMVFTVGALMFHYGAMGGGDVKLMSAAALWTGLSGGLMLVLLVSLYGGVLTLAVLALRRLKRPGTEASAPSRGVPYGVAIAAGVLTIFIVFPGSSGDILRSVAHAVTGVGG